MRDRHPKGRMWMLLASAATVLILVPSMAGAGVGTGGDTDDDAQMIADAKRTDRAVVVAYNNKNWDELGPLWAEDALVLPPNHEPVRGRDAIIEYLRDARDVFGPIDDGWEHIRVKASGTFASLAGLFTLQSGHVRLTYAQLYERQPDGSVLLAVDQFNFRERPVG